MPQQFYIKGTNEALTIEDKPFASGGEGGLYHILRPATYAVGYVAKIIHPHKLSPEREAKVSYLIANRPKFEYSPEHQPIIWIERALHNEKGEFVGFIMPEAIGEKLEVLCAPRMPKHLGEEWQQLQFGTEKALRLRLKICYNVALAVQQIHSTGKYVLVDLKPDNVLIQANGLISLVDTDSVEIVENGQMLFSATVATPDYTPAEYYSRNMEVGKTPIDESWDRFSLAVIFYRILLGIHPFAASCHPPYDNLASLADKIKYGFFVHDAGKKSHFSVIPPPHEAFWRLDEELRHLFIKTFDAGHDDPEARAMPIDWLGVIPNSATAIVDRAIPSEKLAIPDLVQQNWYEVALQQTLKELNLNLPSVSNLPNTARKAVSGGFSELFGKNLSENSSKFWVGIGAVVILLFSGIGMRRSFPFLIMFALVVGLIGYFLFLMIKTLRSKGQNLPQAVGDAVRNVYKSIKNKKKLEDTQHKLFAQRVELKQRLKEIDTELKVIEEVKQKRDRNFVKNQSALMKQVQDASQKKLRSLQQKAQFDQQAQALMREEAQAVKALRAETQAILSAHPVFSRWKGNNPSQKLQQVDFYTSQQSDMSEAEKNQQAKRWRAELQQLAQELEMKIQAVKTEYDAAHEAIFAQAQGFKQEAERLIQAEIRSVRQEIQLDSKLFDNSYKEILRTRLQLLTEQQQQNAQVEQLNEEIRLVREAIAALP